MKHILYVLLFVLFMTSVSAQVIITEVMYDPDGSDTDREWLEIHNTGSEIVDLASWKFLENGVNHGLTVQTGDGYLGAGEVAIIARNKEGFETDYPGYSGDLLTASFGLVNTGEEIGLVNAALITVNLITYPAITTSGQSVQFCGDDNTNADQWSSAAPTPGEVCEQQQEVTGDVPEFGLIGSLFIIIVLIMVRKFT